MLYLSQLILNPRSSEARGDVSDCRALHQRILSAFPDAPDVTAARERYGVLFRVEPLDGGAQALVQSRERPDWSRLPAGYLRRQTGPKRVDDRYDALVAGQELIFRLRANPTRRIDKRKSDEPERWRGKRVELRDEAAQLSWLARKGEAAGFALLAARTQPNEPDRSDVRALSGAGKVSGRRNEQRLTFGSVVFEGRLRVTDPALFRQALEAGIGSGKAFGFGLLSIASSASSALAAAPAR